MSAIDRLNYYTDPRTQAAFRTDRIKIVSEGVSGTLSEVQVDLGDDEPETFPVHLRLAMCSLCHGHGMVVDPSVDASGLTDADLNHPDFDRAYFSGASTIRCPTCEGRRVELDMLSVLEQLPAEVQIALTELEDNDEAFHRVQMAELAFGC